ncbi:MAG: hypothetical protein ACI4J1_01370 [Ruminiclostridium sp.]
MKKTHSIKTKIILLAVVPMLLIAAILLAYAFAGGIMNITSALTDSMGETTKISAEAITNRLSVYETAVNEAAANELFQNANSDPEEIMEYLEGIKERNGFLRIGYTDEKGVNQNGSDFSERQYFKDCREALAPVTSDPYASKDGGGALSVLFCAPIVRNGSFCGIVYGAGDAKLFTDIIILIPNLLIDFVYKESRLKGGKPKPMVLAELVLNGFPAASPHPPQSGGSNL